VRILFVGDIVGRPGKHACARVLPRLIREHDIDVVLANAENAAAGSGITPQIFAKLRHQGIDACTLGDHIYKRREAVELLESTDRAVRSANLPREAVGRELIVLPCRPGRLSAGADVEGVGSGMAPPSVALFSLLGRTYMNVRADCPFHAADRVLAQVPDDVRCIVVDVHAEATGEKIALGWYLDGRVTAVIGTHTHIPTADERILPRGTAYITDVGMTGPYESVLGRARERVIRSLVTGMPQPYDVATGDVRLCAVLIEADGASGRALSIERICERVEPLPPETSNGF
jgi:metallophosphoesterase (TIGR00282 family)